MLRAHVERFGPWLFVGFYVAAVIVFLVAAVYTLSRQERVDRELCASTVANREADRVQWITLRDLILPTVDAEDRAGIELLIEGVLRPIPSLECVDNKPVPKEG